MRTYILSVCKLLFFCMVCTLYSCYRDANLDQVTLPLDSAMNDADRYAVITDTYVSLKDSPGIDGIISGHARRKDIYSVTGTRFVAKGGSSELWIHITEGWLLRSSVELYPTKEKAETAANQLK